MQRGVSIHDASRLLSGGLLHILPVSRCSRRRHVSRRTRARVFAEYGITHHKASGDYEIDHLIPLGLGGSNDLKNLWPQPAGPGLGFHEKDHLEDLLHERVCAHAVPLEEAQKAFAKDWVAAFGEFLGR